MKKYDIDNIPAPRWMLIVLYCCLALLIALLGLVMS